MVQTTNIKSYFEAELCILTMNALRSSTVFNKSIFITIK